jgi:hypothetical protein
MPRGRNDYETAQIQQRLWTPAVLRPAAWFDASDLSTITIATGVSEWRDKSGNARHMTNATGSQQPIYEQFSANGKPSIYFQALSGAGYKTTLNTSANINVVSAFCAVNRETTPNNVFNFVFSQANDNTNFDWASDWDDFLCLTNVETDNWNNGTNFRNGSSISIRTQDFKDVWSIFSFMCAGSMPTSGVGKDRTLGYWGSQGRYAEIIWTDVAQNTQSRLAVEGYLSWKWNIALSADHPYANRPPLIGD